MFSAEKIPVVGSLFDSPEERQAREQFELQAQHLRDMKAPVAESYSNAMGAQLGAYAPSNAMIGDMMGDEYMIDMEAVGQSPVSEGMLQSAKTPDPSAAQKGADFVSGFDPAMGNALSGLLNGFGMF